MSKPILCIIGSTGTGKSKLAIELATRFNGEIISADSMQLYKGLDIVSNKVSPEEQNLVKHYFIDIIEPTDVYTVTDFRRQVDQVIEDIHERNKLPIVVGGTYYYIESILYDKLIKTEDESDKDELTLKIDTNEKIEFTNEDLDSVESFFKKEIQTFSFDNIDSIKLHNLLKQVDPNAANLLHPNDKRKIVRALQVYQKTGRKYSEHLEEQHKNGGGQAKISGQLRFNNSLIFNLEIDTSILHERIEKRTEEMVKKGLIDELSNFYKIYNEILKNKEYDYLDKRKGIFQVIGLKEFDEYFKYVEKNILKGKPIIDNNMINNEEIKAKLIDRGIDNLKIITKKYSKTQTDWFKNRFLANMYRRPTPPIFNFNVNDLDKWNVNVLEPSAQIVDHILIKEQSVDQLTDDLKKFKAEEYNKILNKKQLRYCEYCDKSIVDEIIWQNHLKSKGHERNYNKWLKEKEIDELVNKIKFVSKISLVILTGVLIGYLIRK